VKNGNEKAEKVMEQEYKMGRGGKVKKMEENVRMK